MSQYKCKPLVISIGLILKESTTFTITLYRAKSARIRVITPDDDLITAPSQPRAKSALPAKREIIRY